MHVINEVAMPSLSFSLWFHMNPSVVIFWSYLIVAFVGNCKISSLTICMEWWTSVIDELMVAVPRRKARSMWMLPKLRTRNLIQLKQLYTGSSTSRPTITSNIFDDLYYFELYLIFFLSDKERRSNNIVQIFIFVFLLIIFYCGWSRSKNPDLFAELALGQSPKVRNSSNHVLY